LLLFFQKKKRFLSTRFWPAALDASGDGFTLRAAINFNQGARD